MTSGLGVFRPCKQYGAGQAGGIYCCNGSRLNRRNKRLLGKLGAAYTRQYSDRTKDLGLPAIMGTKRVFADSLRHLSYSYMGQRRKYMCRFSSKASRCICVLCA